MQEDRLLDEELMHSRRANKRSSKNLLKDQQEQEGKMAKRTRRHSPSARVRQEASDEPKEEILSMEPGDPKARALAAVRAYLSSLPDMQYGRDEGWNPRDESRGIAASPANQSGRERKDGSGKRARENSAQGKEKKSKTSKLASIREERHKEELESKQRLSQVSSEDRCA